MRLRQAAVQARILGLRPLARELRAIARDPVGRNASLVTARSELAHAAAPLPNVSQSTAQLAESRVATEPPAYTRDAPLGWWERKW
jgi:hypothetical protein